MAIETVTSRESEKDNQKNLSSSGTFKESKRIVETETNKME